jgi:DNA replication and repair protein RecF
VRLRRLVAHGFRNLAPFDLDTSTQFVVFHGDNAQGKTNVLGAIWMLATLKALRGRRRSELICWGERAASLSGWVTAEAVERHHRVDLTPSGREVAVDGKRISDLRDYFSGIRAICFTPQDGRIVSDVPAGRRRWLDRAAFTARPAHLGVVKTYRRCVQQKSAALRLDRPDPAVLDALDVQLAMAGAELAHRRAEMLAELAPHVSEVYGVIADHGAEVRLSYVSAARGDTLQERVTALHDKVSEARSDELRRCMCLVGPQKDNVEVALDGRSARSFGSRGQVRSTVLALKLAEMVAARERGEVPLFLLDDVSSELDKRRTGRLVDVLRNLKAQVFATTTDPTHLEPLPKVDTRFVRVDRGSLHVHDKKEAESPE